MKPSPFDVSQVEIETSLVNVNHLFDLHKLLNNQLVKKLVKEIEPMMPGIEVIPGLTQEMYNESEKGGIREIYENAYDKRRVNVSVSALMLMLGDNQYKTVVEKYLLAICDETTWVVPAHKGRSIDIYVADTTLTIAEIVAHTSHLLDKEVIQKVYETVANRIFKPYMEKLNDQSWYKSHDNWNSVCNSCIGSAYLLLEPDIHKKSAGVKQVLEGLREYIHGAFKPDGSTQEGLLYWHYGMWAFTLFSQHLLELSGGKIDLFEDDQLKKIASFPQKMILGNNLYISFSDLPESDLNFNPGLIQKVAERTGEKGILGLINKTVSVDCYEFPNILRYFLWWDGQTHQSPPIQNEILPDAGIIKIAKDLGGNHSLIVAAKAGNNGEGHNHNDVGSFIVSYDGENFLTDPGAGKYSGDYFNENRYKNIFANSFGHSVPVIDGQLQSQGEKFKGKIIESDHIEMEMFQAYDLEELVSLKRTINFESLTDVFVFKYNSPKIEEAFITWKTVKQINPNKVEIVGRLNTMILEIDPTLTFELQELKAESLANEKSEVLKRIVVKIPETELPNVKFTMKFWIDGQEN